jgi:hypothetical protein
MPSTYSPVGDRNAIQPPAAPAAPVAAAVDVGEIAGAPYRLEIPAGWQGDLLVFRPDSHDATYHLNRKVVNFRRAKRPR